jgi:2-oxoglutarate ferredoxin oxidoreductase subunit alpha
MRWTRTQCIACGHCCAKHLPRLGDHRGQSLRNGGRSFAVEKELWKGNEAIAEAAIRAGCDGPTSATPSRPQSEVPEYMSLHGCPSIGRACSCRRKVREWRPSTWSTARQAHRRCGAMTSSSSPGVSLKQEGHQLHGGRGAARPSSSTCMRGGPGLGTIQPGQGDYYQATRSAAATATGAPMVLAPASVQEAVDLRAGGLRPGGRLPRARWWYWRTA